MKLVFKASYIVELAILLTVVTGCLYWRPAVNVLNVIVGGK